MLASSGRTSPAAESPTRARHRKRYRLEGVAAWGYGRSAAPACLRGHPDGGGGSWRSAPPHATAVRHHAGLEPSQIGAGQGSVTYLGGSATGKRDQQRQEPGGSSGQENKYAQDASSRAPSPWRPDAIMSWRALSSQHAVVACRARPGPSRGWAGDRGRRPGPQLGRPTGGAAGDGPRRGPGSPERWGGSQFKPGRPHHRLTGSLGQPGPL